MRALALLLLASCAGPDLAPDELHVGYGFGDGSSTFDGPRAGFDTDVRMWSVGFTWDLSSDLMQDPAPQLPAPQRCPSAERYAQPPPEPAPVLERPGPSPVVGLVRGVVGAIGGEPWAAAAAGLLTVVGGVFASSKRARARAKKVVRYVRRKR